MKRLIKLLKEKSGVTSKTHNHTHKYMIDDAGNGETISTIPKSVTDHVHRIKSYKVLPSKDGHRHNEIKK